MIKKVAGVQFHSWDLIYDFDPEGLDLKKGDQVIVKTELGQEMGVVVNIQEKEEDSALPLKSILRKVNLEDLKKIDELIKKKKKVMDKCKELIKKHQLEMKLVDCHFSFDGGKITFAFTADKRIDFRELVKDLSRAFQKSIRLHQIGIRDEAKRLGEFGPCGRELCCRKFLENLGSVTTGLAKIQQISHRGSERISGVCGRLMCCLAYESKFYEEESKNLPAIGLKVKTKYGTGRVVSLNVLKKTVNVELEKNEMIEISAKEIKY